MFKKFFPWMCALALMLPSVALSAQPQWGPQSRERHPAYNEGYQRGSHAGTDDSQRGRTFNFSDKNDYRRGDAGYRSSYGSRDNYRVEFRLGFQAGYQGAYSYGRGGPGRGVPGRIPPGRAVGRFDVAVQQGHSDGYEAGLNDGRNRNQFNPVGERRYRSADRGYNRSYGDKERYKANYRSGFRGGYEAGYAAGARYSSRW